MSVLGARRMLHSEKLSKFKAIRYLRFAEHRIILVADARSLH